VIWKGVDDLGRALARRESRRTALGSGLRAGARPLAGPPRATRIDTVSRALAGPISRRRAIGVISGTLVAGGALRPGFAGAVGYDCSGKTPQKCANPGGAQVCVGTDWACCSNTLCAAACPPWQFCADGGAACEDNALMCYAKGAGADGKHTHFCSLKLPDPGDYCNDYQPRTVKHGWCCLPGEQCSKTKFGECKCTGENCDDLCCEAGYGCQRNRFSANECVKLCNNGSRRCGTECCGGQTHCAGDHCECTPPSVSCGTGCCNPKKTADQPKVQPSALENFINTIRQTSSSHGGSGHRSASRSPARQAAVAAGPGAALGALAAVNAQGGAALGAFTDGHHDSAFKRKVTAARPSLARLRAAPGLDAGSASKLNALLAAEARAYAAAAAGATALARARAARTKNDRARARTQLLASARFADQAARALKSVPALRAAAVTALRAGGTAEVLVTADQVSTLQAGVRRGGVPADLRAVLAGLGVRGSADLAHVRAGLVSDVISVDSIAGPALIAPLADPARAKLVRTTSSELARYAAKARKHPIARGQ